MTLGTHNFTNGKVPKLVQSFLVLVAVLQISCASYPRHLQTIGRENTDSAVVAAPKSLFVSEAFYYKKRFAYPAGSYIAKFSDEHGIYYEAPKSITHDAIPAAETLVGGLYFETGHQNEPCPYFEYQDTPYHFRDGSFVVHYRFGR